MGSLLALLLLLLLLLLLREEDVVDGDVHLGDPQAKQVLDPPYDVAAHGLGCLVDGPAVLDAHAQVHRRLDLAHLHRDAPDRKSTRLNSSHANISYAVFCLKKKKKG